MLAAASLRCEPSGRAAVVAVGTTLLAAVVRAGLPIAHSCRGEGLCGRCRVVVLDGHDRLSPVGAAECAELARIAADPGERLACCARVEGAVTVTTTYW